MAILYNGTEDEINFEYTNQYVKECIRDILLLPREYTDDFYILPIEYITVNDGEAYHLALSKAAENMILSMFSTEYNDIQDFYAKNETYEDIENNLLPQIKKSVDIWWGEDIKMPLRDRCTNYLNQMVILCLWWKYEWGAIILFTCSAILHANNWYSNGYGYLSYDSIY